LAGRLLPSAEAGRENEHHQTITSRDVSLVPSPDCTLTWQMDDAQQSVSVIGQFRNMTNLSPTTPQRHDDASNGNFL
jgi:hypothetical protein